MTVGDDALSGVEEYIDERHDFIVTTQTCVKAEGVLVQVFRTGQGTAELSGKSTEAEGWEVSAGDKVRVYKAKVVFE